MDAIKGFEGHTAVQAPRGRDAMRFWDIQSIACP